MTFESPEMSNESPDNTVSDAESVEKLDLRGELWKIICKLDTVKEEMLEEYKQNIGKPEKPFKYSCANIREEAPGYMSVQTFGNTKEENKDKDEKDMEILHLEMTEEESANLE